MAERKDDGFEVYSPEKKHERMAQLNALSESELLMFRDAAMLEYSRIEHDVHYVNHLLNRKGYRLPPLQGEL